MTTNHYLSPLVPVPRGCSRDTLIDEVTQDYLANLSLPINKSLKDIKEELISLVNAEIDNENFATRAKKEYAFKHITNLFASQIGDVLLKTQHIYRVAGAGLDGEPEHDRLVIYNEFGEDEGIYTPADETIERLSKELCYEINERGMEEVKKHCFLFAERKERTEDPDLIAVNNGIFDFKNKQLLSFGSEYIFLSKVPVNYDPFASNVYITNTDGTVWDVESWMKSLSDDDEVVDLLWQSLSALVRPFVSWNRALFFISESGCNGKGTLLELMRGLCGRSASCASLSMLARQFGASMLYGKTAVLSDENDTKGYIENAEVVKALITNDKVPLEKKHKDPVDYRFRGVAVFNLNAVPHIKDHSLSMWRRVLAVRFPHSFFQNGENKAIKSDYVKRKDVLQYVLKRVLHMNVYEFTEPVACQLELDEFKLANDTVRQFAEEILPECKWDLLPFGFLWDLYKSYYNENNPSGKICGKITFINDLLNLISSEDYGWECPGRDVPIRSGTMMNQPEPLILRYRLGDWQNPFYTGRDPDKICLTCVKSAYRGIKRKNVITEAGEAEDDTGETI